MDGAEFAHCVVVLVLVVVVVGFWWALIRCVQCGQLICSELVKLVSMFVVGWFADDTLAMNGVNGLATENFFH